MILSQAIDPDCNSSPFCHQELCHPPGFLRGGHCVKDIEQGNCSPWGSLADPIRVVVTGASGQISYSLLYLIGNGDVFGKEQPIILHLFCVFPLKIGVVEGVAMELADCALPLLKEVITTSDLAVAFKDVDAAFMVGSVPRKEGMERKDLLSANVKIFKEQGQALNKFAKKSVKVLVVGNPANTNALMCSHYAPSIPKENFSAMTRLDHNRAQAAIAARLCVPVTNVKNVIIWGNHSSTQFPDTAHAYVTMEGQAQMVDEVIGDEKWLKGEFISMIQGRGAAVIAARKKSSAMSAAKAAADHMKTIWLGTPPGEFVSMAVISDGSYNVPKDIVFSFPVTIDNKRWQIVKNLSMSAFAKSKLEASAKELIEEREDAMSVLEG